MRRVKAPTYAFLASLAISSSAFAQPPAALKAEAQVSPSAERLGLAAHSSQDSVKLWSCEEDCRSGVPSLSVSLPAELHGHRPKKRVITLQGGAEALLWSFAGTDQREFVVLVMGAKAGTKKAPRLILKGWSEEAKRFLSVQESKEGARVFLTSDVQEQVCGRKLPTKVQVLDPRSGRFRRARPPVLSAQERKAAVSHALVPVQKQEGALPLRLDVTAQSSMRPVDGDRQSPWSRAYEFAEVSFPAGLESKALYLQLAESAEPSASQLWLATEHQVYSLDLPAQSGGLFKLELPEGAECAAFVQPKKTAPVTEVFAQVVPDQPLSTDELILRLEDSEPHWAAAALAYRGIEAARALAVQFPRLNARGRAQAIEVATRLPGAQGAALQVAVIESGDEQQVERARQTLAEYPHDAALAVGQRLSLCSEEKLPALVEFVVELDERVALESLLAALSGEQVADRRLVMRDGIGRLAGSDRGRVALHKSLKSSAQLDRKARVELLRALRYELKHFGPELRTLALGLVNDASFEEAYLMTPALVAVSRKSAPLQQKLTQWLKGELPAGLGAQPRYALQVQILSQVTEQSADLGALFAPETAGLLESENVRVRGAALERLAQIPSAEFVDAAEKLARKDAWPRVRSSAATALAAAALHQGQGDAQADLISFLAKRSRKEEDPAVRRTVVKSLSRLPSEEAVTALRRALEKDEDYSVRAEAARGLGRLCDMASVEELTTLAHELARAPVGDGPITLSLAALSALIDLHPKDLDARLAPLLGDQLPGPLKIRVEARLTEMEDAPACKQ